VVGTLASSGLSKRANVEVCGVRLNLYVWRAELQIVGVQTPADPYVIHGTSGRSQLVTLGQHWQQTLLND
jgi:hypothetical protein